MGDRRQTGKLSRYLTSHPGQLSLAIRPWVGVVSTSDSWVVYRRTTRCTGPVSVVWQCKLVSGWGLRKRRSARCRPVIAKAQYSGSASVMIMLTGIGRWLTSIYHRGSRCEIVKCTQANIYRRSGSHEIQASSADHYVEMNTRLKERCSKMLSPQT